ncbi:hypothetical protein EJ02DRAFT_506291 [Clathrospora elynae]|uniref:Integral membrane protein TmpA n=1 Tax=Clathrospora elynae TaxID=706981 RepID=A0A6A5S868_9PLEO|nr:hypothetical protein EJ02DRAFT_506291 [Clathrospora elynae]
MDHSSRYRSHTNNNNNNNNNNNTALLDCTYEHWWGRSKRTSKKDHQQLEHEPIPLPLPSLPRALEFVPNHFLLPPSYEQVIDVEKAVHLSAQSRWSNDNVSTRSFPSASSGSVLSKTRIRQEPSVCPPKRGIRVMRHLRYTIFTVYRRLFTFIFVLNGIGVFILLRQRYNSTEKAVNLDTLATIASANFLLAILVRQDFLVNLLFRAAWLVPWNVPLRIRRVVARVYCYGGLHSSAAVAGTIWWIFFTVVMSWTFFWVRLYTFPLLVLTWVVSILLTMILLLAFPSMRARHHDIFEITHRFLGWTSIALFWVQLLLLTNHTSTSLPPAKFFGSLLILNPTFWNLTAITLLLIYPWLHLRRWTFTAHPLSTHALRLSFPNPVDKFSCLSISSSPWREWHPFATFPSTDPDGPGASMVISDAGDWTRKLIQHAHMRDAIHRTLPHSYGGSPNSREGQGEKLSKMRFWIKSHPKAGVLSLSCLFPRVLILTTGSGIGPALSSLLDRPDKQFARLVWSSRDPVSTYGSEILALARKADAEALVIDTTALGRPDLLDVAWKMYREVQAEAVFVLSNGEVTRRVVEGLERRGVPAFGPIWDS